MRIFFILIFLMNCFLLQAQTPMLSNQGALVSIKDGAFVAVHGDALNEQAGTFHNSDTLHLYGDWENNAGNEAFTSQGEGVVTFRGDSQYIRGVDITRFYDLRMENQGVKYAEDIDVYVDGFLRLNDREFNLDTNVVHVFNTDLNAVSTGLNNIWGFVSSLENGGLLRHTANSAAYAYPLGSASGVNRFRPIHIRPETNQTAAYRARFANTDPSNESYDRNLRAFEICEINEQYYHRIARTQGSVAAEVDFFYDEAQDGSFSDLGQWETISWQEETTLTLNNNVQYGLDQLSTDQAIADFSTFPFAFINVSPPIDLAADANPICTNDTLTLEATGAYSNFDFFVDTFWVQDGASSFYTTQLDAGQHPVWVVASNANCGRISDTIVITTYQSPTVQASPDTIIIEGTAANLYASGADFYSWTPAADLSCDICPTTNANPLETTTYTVIGESIDGCRAVDTVYVEVKADAEQVLFIPNVITPNGDGKNDSWRIENIQLFPRNKVQIVNRWGDLVYKSEFYNNNFDGSYSGGLLPSGTYYYILDLGDGWGVFKGPLTIIRK
jgi:gliding motility-associated-like protein